MGLDVVDGWGDGDESRTLGGGTLNEEMEGDEGTQGVGGVPCG